MTLTVKNIQFKTLSEHEKVLTSFNPQASDILNLSFWIPSPERITLVLKDPTAYVELDVDATVEGFTTPTGIRLEYQKFFYILKSYSPEELADLTLCITQDEENSTFDIYAGADKLSLPHSIITTSQLEEFEELHSQLISCETIDTPQLSLSSIESIPDFIGSLSTCLDFVSSDEKENNAVAIYEDHLVVNDRRHVYTNYSTRVSLKDSEFILLHKKIASIFLGAYTSCPHPIESFIVFDSANRAYLQTSNLKCLLNNSIANVTPPSVDELNDIKPQKKVCDIDSTSLWNTSHFFSGFYPSTLELKPITLNYSSKEPGILNIKLRDSGLRGGSCSIERKLSGLTIDSDDFEAIVLNTSLGLFLSKFKKETIVELWVDQIKNAVYLKTAESDIYLSKLI